MTKRKLEDAFSITDNLSDDDDGFSDSGSSYSGSSEISVDSIIEELNEIIERSEEITNEINNSIKTLEEITTLINNGNCINIQYADFKGDLNDLIEKAHKDAILNIKEKGVNNFGQKLLEIIENGQFIN